MPKMCALMRQSWYESATKNLSSVEQLAFFRACFDFEFYGKEPTAEEVPFSSVLRMHQQSPNRFLLLQFVLHRGQHQ